MTKELKQLTDIQFISRYNEVSLILSRRFAQSKSTDGLPLVFNRLDDESQRRANRVDVLVHDFLDDGGFARIV